MLPDKHEFEEYFSKKRLEHAINEISLAGVIFKEIPPLKWHEKLRYRITGKWERFRRWLSNKIYAWDT